MIDLELFVRGTGKVSDQVPFSGERDKAVRMEVGVEQHMYRSRANSNDVQRKYAKSHPASASSNRRTSTICRTWPVIGLHRERAPKWE